MKTLILTLIFIVTFTAGCATDTGDPVKDRRGRVVNELGKQVFNAVLSWGTTQGVDALTGRNGQDAAAGAFEAARSSFDIGRIVDAYAGPQVAAVVAQQMAVANPQTPKEKTFFANVIGAALQLAANQFAK